MLVPRPIRQFLRVTQEECEYFARIVYGTFSVPEAIYAAHETFA
jgi:hypothetical protein